MRLMKKIAFLLAALMLLTAGLAGCGGSGDSGDTGAADSSQTGSQEPADTGADTADDTGADAASDGTALVMGTNAAFPPYEFVDENNAVAGIDAEIAAALAEKLGMTLEIKDMAFDSLIPAVQGGAIDMAMAGMTVNAERLESVDFTDSYATGVQVVIVPEDSEIAEISDLEGKTVGVQSGTTGDIYCTDEYGQENVKQFDNGALAVAALTNGQVDCVVIDNEPAKNFVAANSGLKILETEYAVEEYAIAVAKENTELLDSLNAAMAELKADGTIDGIINKFISAE